MKKILLMLVLLVVSTAAFAQQPPHYTDLSWQAVVPQGPTGTAPAQTLTGYNIYKSATKGVYTKGTPFVTVLFGTNTYHDTAVTPGATWFYVATTVCSNCVQTESGFSNEVTAVTPLDKPVPPTPPTNLTGDAH